MNERIRELYRQAWKEAYNVDPDDPRIVRAHKAMEEGMKKFAESLVRACADAADEAHAAGCEYAGDFVAEHMGFGEQGGVAAWRAKND